VHNWSEDTVIDSRERRAVNTRTGKKGSALLLAAIAILIAGLATAGILYSLESVTRETQEEKTIYKMHHVIHAFSVYVQKNQRLPCPADPNASGGSGGEPFGTERGSAATGGLGSGSCDQTTDLGDGIVPFKTLGLNEDDAKDGWGRYFTYHGNQTNLMNSADAASWLSANKNAPVDQICRVKDVWMDSSKPGTWWYPQVVTACCLDPTIGMRVVNAAGQSVTAIPGTGGNTGPAHTNVPIPALKAPYTLAAPPAIVLISHGRNGIGAYLGTGTHARMGRDPILATFSAATSNGEQSNAEGDLLNHTTFYLEPRTEGSANYFDDIVMSESLPSLYAEVGNNNGSGPGCNWNPGCPPIPVAQAIANGFTNGQTPSPMQDVYGNNCPSPPPPAPAPAPPAAPAPAPPPAPAPAPPPAPAPAPPPPSPAPAPPPPPPPAPAPLPPPPAPVPPFTPFKPPPCHHPIIECTDTGCEQHC
jgi:hypothetical protein